MTDGVEVQIVRIQIIALIGSLLLTLFIFNLVRKGKLKEKHSLLWFGASLAILVLSVFRGLLDRVARFIGIAYAPAALFLAALGFGFLLFLYFSITISDLVNKTKRLSQEIGLLRQKLEKLIEKGKNKKG
jgi:hypothetical protein